LLAEADEPAMTPQEFIEKITELERKKNDPGILDKLLKLLGFDKSGGQKLYTIKVGGADQKFLWYPDKSVFIQIDPPLFKMRSGADIDPATLKGKGSTFPNVDSFNTLVDRAKRTEGKDKEAFILQMQDPNKSGLVFKYKVGSENPYEVLIAYSVAHFAAAMTALARAAGTPLDVNQE